MNIIRIVIKKTVIGLSCAILITGCASNTANITSGVLLGGLAGAATCLADNSCNKVDRIITRSLAGAVVGGAVGWGINHMAATKTVDAGNTAKALGYNRIQGTLVKFQTASVQPEMITLGKPITLHMEYNVLTPDNRAVAVKEKWVILYDGKVLKELKNDTKWREPGRWRSDVSINLPNNIAAGTYVIKNHIQSGTVYDEENSIFYVKKNA